MAAFSVNTVVRNQLQGVNDATGDLVEAVAKLLELTDKIGDKDRELAGDLRVELNRILKDANTISRSVNTAAVVTSGAPSTVS